MIFSLDTQRLILLRDCIAIGLEAAAQNAENTDDDIMAIQTIVDEIEGIAAKDASAEITVMRADSVGDPPVEFLRGMRSEEDYQATRCT